MTNAMRAALALLFSILLPTAAVLLPACGDRTAPFVWPVDASAETGADAPHDAPRDSALDAPIDSPLDALVDAPPDAGCDDGIACTRDLWNPRDHRCKHVPDDSQCPDTQLCSVKRGCDAFVYVVAADGHLHELRVTTGDAFDDGPPGPFAGDVALADDSTLYLTDSYILYSVDRETAEATAVGSILPLHQYNGLGRSPSSAMLYATADVPQLFDVDTASAASSQAAILPGGYRASGDVAMLAGRVLVSLATSAHPQTDSLGVIDLGAGTSNVVGDFGFRCVWGLAVLGGAVYGTTCEGRLLAVDPSSGAAKEIAKNALAWFGAAGR